MKESSIQQNSITLKARKFIKEALLLFFIGGLSVTAIFGKYMGVTDTRSFILTAVFQGMVWVILWMGNGMIQDYLTKKFSWLDRTEVRFTLGILATIVYTLGSLTIWLTFWLILVHDMSFKQAISIFEPSFYFSALLITAFISMFFHGWAFLKEWRNSASEAERLKNENLKARFETLKNQVNPHFLFNSFNVLSTLVYKDQDKAAKFIKQMSNLYRYVLETKDKETVKISEETEALEAFTYLSKMRFSDNLDIQIDLDGVKDFQIAPMTLQMLVENAIKHNVVSKAKPLKVDVSHDAYDVIVTNNLQRKNSVTASTGIGLPNIQARYEYLTDQPISITETNTDFIVKIPLLSYESNSH